MHCISLPATKVSKLKANLSYLTGEVERKIKETAASLSVAVTSSGKASVN